jgi:hypothetical protein
LHGTIGTVNRTLNGLHGTVGTVNRTLNGLHGTVGTENGTVNGLHGTIRTENGLNALASISKFAFQKLSLSIIFIISLRFSHIPLSTPNTFAKILGKTEICSNKRRYQL